MRNIRIFQLISFGLIELIRFQSRRVHITIPDYEHAIPEMASIDEFNPFGQYKGSAPKRRERIVRWFHNNRLKDFASWVEPGDRLLSVGAGNGELEAKILSGRFDSICALDLDQDRCKTAHEKDLVSVQGSVPPLPFEEDSFDAIVAAGTIEHLPDERGFLAEASRCLQPEGILYLTLPVEIGIGGLMRHLGRTFVYPQWSDENDGIQRYFEYSREELFGTVPRDKGGTGHRYYNYRYALDDLEELFSDVSVRGWPVEPLEKLNLILFAKARYYSQ